MVQVQSVDDKAVFVFVGDVNAHHSEWLESVSPTDRMGVMLSNFAIWRIVNSGLGVKV